MVEMQLFASVPNGPTPIESALLDWVISEAKREYDGLCPRAWYAALLGAASRLANPAWKDLKDFPKPLSTILLEAHYAEYRTMHANYVAEAPTHELQDKMKWLRKRRRRKGVEPSYEDIVERAWVEEELCERASIATMMDEGPA